MPRMAVRLCVVLLCATLLQTISADIPAEANDLLSSDQLQNGVTAMDVFDGEGESKVLEGFESEGFESNAATNGDHWLELHEDVMETMTDTDDREDDAGLVSEL